MKKAKTTRYSQLSKVHRNALINETGHELILFDAFDSFTGASNNLKYFQNSLALFKKEVSSWKDSKIYTFGFISVCNDEQSNSKRTYETFQSQFKNGFAKFITESKRANSAIYEIDAEVIYEFEGWLKKRTIKGVPISINTQRRYFAIVRRIFEKLISIPSTSKYVSKNILFSKNPFPRAHAHTKKTETIDDHIWDRLVAACRKEASATIDLVEDGWRILSKKEIFPDEKITNRSKYKSYSVALWELHRTFPKVIPSFPEIKNINDLLYNAVAYIHGKEKLCLPLQPSVDRLIPFVVLFAIYTLANTGSIRALKSRQAKEVEVLGSKRIVFTFEKGRSHSKYSRSFSRDDIDPLSPNRLIEFIQKWTNRIRSTSGQFSDNIFIFVSQVGTIRGFLSAVDSGTDSDSSWIWGLRQFLKRNDLPHITLRIVRTTGLDIIRDLTGDDIRAVKSAGGQKSSAVIALHYEGSASSKRRNESLSAAMHSLEPWVSTAGRNNPRGTPDDSDIIAATPGWTCLDPYDSPIAGETRGKLCNAFGRCPVCPHAMCNAKSSYSLARAIQLAEEIIRAQTYLDRERWIFAYEPSLIALRNQWIPSFIDKKIIQNAAKLNLSPIGKLE